MNRPIFVGPNGPELDVVLSVIGWLALPSRLPERRLFLDDLGSLVNVYTDAEAWRALEHRGVVVLGPTHQRCREHAGKAEASGCAECRWRRRAIWS